MRIKFDYKKSKSEIKKLVSKKNKYEYLKERQVVCVVECNGMKEYKKDYTVVISVYYDSVQKERVVMVSYDFKATKLGTRNLYLVAYDSYSTNNFMVDAIEKTKKDWISLSKENFWLNLNDLQQKKYNEQVVDFYDTVLAALHCENKKTKKVIDSN